MPAEREAWPTVLERTLERYDDGLLRRVVGRLLRPRNQWPRDELVRRTVATTSDVALVDRRLKELDPAEQQLLALVGHSRQPAWALGNLVELLISLGHADGLGPALSLLEAGLLFPVLPESAPGKVKAFDQWLTFGGAENLRVFAHPLAASRAVGADLGMGECPPVVDAGPALEADGLEWPLRLAVLWQMVAGAPLRRTQQGEFFKRDLDRLDNDPLLNGPSPEGLPALPSAGFLAVALAERVGLLTEEDGELRAAPLPAEWEGPLPEVLAALWTALPSIREWTPLDGWRAAEAGGNPFPSACLLVLLLLARLPAGAWADPAALQEWVTAQHPFWAGQEVRPSRRRDWVSPFLFGLAYPLRLVQAARAGETWVARLAPLGRWLLGLADAPAEETAFPKTLLVQPNLEIIAYRQGLTPPLIARLTRFAAWRGLGSACTLQLGPDSVYRALEGGLTFDAILHTLEQHGTRAIPPAVLESLRTWSNKRERISVYPSAALVEFNTAEQLEEALARGFPGVRIGERLAVAASESAIDYSLFRLTASKDYAATPEKCVEVEDDGVTLTVDLARSDLLLESELARFAESVDRPDSNGRRRYRLTPDSLAAGRSGGLTVQGLETWFSQRVGQPPSPASLLLLAGSQWPAAPLRPHLVLHVATPELADGLMQWPDTRELIDARLGPTALSVPADNVDRLRQQLCRAGLSCAERSAERRV